MERFAFYDIQSSFFEDHFSIPTPHPFTPNYNVSPGSRTSILSFDSGDSPYRSLVAKWSQEQLFFSIEVARQELLNGSKRLCLIPANGFFVWKAGFEEALPFLVRSITSPLLFFGGILDQDTLSFSIVETKAELLLFPITPSMPLLVSPGNLPSQTTPAELLEYWTRPSSSSIDLGVVRVPDLVKDPSLNTPELVQPIPKVREEEEG
ncbi:MAG: SOS response-associated peptidase family protein [Bacteroidota bacterium]